MCTVVCQVYWQQNPNACQSLKLFLKIFNIYVIIQLRFLEWLIKLILEEIACRPTSKVKEESIN